jgi:hypothetical protein
MFSGSEEESRSYTSLLDAVFRVWVQWRERVKTICHLSFFISHLPAEEALPSWAGNER